MTPPTPSLLLIAALAYLAGGFNAGFYLVRARTGDDLRHIGSGSSGARNAGRVLGRAGFLLVFAGDALKGTLAVVAASMMGLGRPGMSVAMLAAILGHVLPAQLHFRGGRGASTAFGAMFAFAPLAAAATFSTCMVLYLVTRRQVASGVAAFVAMPVLAALTGYSRPDIATVTLAAGILVATHRSYLPELVSALGHASASTEVAK